MVTKTVIIATIIGAMTSVALRKKNHMRSSTRSPARGAAIPICLNISAPNVSSATGSPVTWYPCEPSKPAAISSISAAMTRL